MTRSRAGRDGVPGPLAPLYYAQRAGAGLIVTEATQVAPRGPGLHPDTPGIHDDAQVAGWRRVTDAVHAAGGRIFLQLWHVGRVSHTSLPPAAALPVSRLGRRARGRGVDLRRDAAATSTPRALETEEVAGVVAQFRHGAELAKAAGFDGVEIHGANGYLIDQFLRDGTNRRTDRYGGSAENRARFLLEVTEAVVGRLGWRTGWACACRRVGAFNGMSDSDPATTFGPRSRRWAASGWPTCTWWRQLGGAAAAGAASRLRGIRERWHGPSSRTAAYDAARGAEAVAIGLGHGLVAYGVPFLANPDLPLRLLTGAQLNEPDKATFYGGDARRAMFDYPPRPRSGSPPEPFAF